MDRRSENRRRARNVHPQVERVESRALLSASAGLASSLHPAVQARGTHHATVAPTSHGWVRTRGIGGPASSRSQFVATFRGDYEAATLNTNTIATAVRLTGSGQFTGSPRASLDSIVASSKPGSNVPTLGVLELSPQDPGAASKLRLRILAAPGAAGSPIATRYSWVVDPTSEGTWHGATGQGTLTIRFVKPTSQSGSPLVQGTYQLKINGSLAV